MLRGELNAYFSPSIDNLTEFWRWMKQHLQPVISYKNEQTHRMELITGGVLECWSLKQGITLRGRKYHRVTVDEAAHGDHEDTWYGVIRPTLTDYRGRGLFISTTRGRNWFWTLYGRGVDPDDSDYESFHYPSSANPYIEPAEIEAARRDLPDRLFRQEYLAEFLDDGGGVFRGVREVCVLPVRPPEAGRMYLGGIDWGQQDDYTVFTLMDADTREQVFLLRVNHSSYKFMRQCIIDACEAYQPALVYAEINSIGAPNIEELQALGLPVHAFNTTNASKSDVIQSLVMGIEKQEIRLLDDPVQRMELEAYEATRLPSGRWQYSAPAGKHDDCVIALALANHALFNRPGTPFRLKRGR